MYQSGEKVIPPTREAGSCAPTAAPGSCKKAVIERPVHRAHLAVFPIPTWQSFIPRMPTSILSSPTRKPDTTGPRFVECCLRVVVMIQAPLTELIDKGHGQNNFLILQDFIYGDNFLFKPLSKR